MCKFFYAKRKYQSRLEILATGCNSFPMKKTDPHTRRQLLHGLGVIAGLPLLSSCGSLIYPGRVNQKERGGLDPAIVILDGIGLFFFIIPGLIAFAVDFGTGAIYYPAGKDNSDPEETLFDQWQEEASETSSIDLQTIERSLSERVGRPIRLDEETVLVQELDSLDRFSVVYRKLAIRHMLARS
jgi:hypothetical protein